MSSLSSISLKLLCYNQGNLSVSVETLLKEIEDIKNKTEQIVRDTIWPHIQQAQAASNLVKIGAMKIGMKLSQIAQLSIGSDQIEKIENYWEQSIKSMRKYCDWLSEDENINYDNWFNLSTLYCQRIQFFIKHLIDLDADEKIILIYKGLAAIDQALKIKDPSEAIFLKFLLLQLLEDSNQRGSEPAIVWMKKFLDSHSDSQSDEYLRYAQLYGGELAKKGNLNEAITWFEFLLDRKENAITCLYLGKIYDQLMNTQSALVYFEKALQLDKENLEIKLWLVSIKVKDKVNKFHQMNQIPSSDEIREWVDVCNEFCSTFSSNEDLFKGETSTFIPLSELAQHIYVAQLPEMANILAHLQQYQFALDLYQCILENFYTYLKLGVFGTQEIAKLYTNLGVLYLKVENFQQAEEHLLKAIDLDKNYLSAYQNLAGVYAVKKDKANLIDLWKQIKPSIDTFVKIYNNEALSPLLFNFGTAYVLLAENPSDRACTTAKEFYKLSLSHDRDNWDTRIQFARILALEDNQEQWIEAKNLLSNFENYEKTLVFEVSPLQKFQLYFFLSGILSLCNDIGAAKEAAIKAGKTSIDKDKVHTLQSYLNNFNKIDKSTFNEQIRESIRKISFNFRIGKLVNSENIIINQNSFIGYHGTTDNYIEGFKNGIMPRDATIRQFKGKGFYIAENRDIACYFAMKKARDEKKGSPILWKIYASQLSLVGQEVDAKAKLKKGITIDYDFVKAPIDGFEAYSQYYVFENSLEKLKPPVDFETVNWNDERYDQFLLGWTRSGC